MSLRWLIPFSERDQPGCPAVSHLIDTSEWISRRLCIPLLVNTRLAAPPRATTRRCSMCQLLTEGRSAERFRPRERASVDVSA